MKISKERLQNIKLIVFDLDGTLLNDAGELPEETAAKIKGLNLLGVKTTIATGRIHAETAQFARALNLNCPVISSNGAAVIDYPSGKIISLNVIPNELFERIVKLLKKYEAEAAFVSTEKIFHTGDAGQFQSLLKTGAEKFLYIKNFNNLKGKIIEIVAIMNSLEKTKEFLEHFKFPSVIGLKLKYFRSTQEKEKFYIRIKKAGYSKALALRELAEHLSLKIDEIAVVGGGYNDRSLFAAGFFKVAVANALPELKETADYVTRRANNEGAALEFLDLVINGRS